MRFQLRSVVLWPRDDAKRPRSVEFEPGMVNVITGASKTGKSAIIPIIDYCLASDKCAVPVGPIREACAWFGIVLRSERGELLLARREPGAQQATRDMYLAEGKAVSVPPVLERNVSSDSVKRRLDDLVGLSNIGFDIEGRGSGFKGRPSFRDLVAFLFQPQNLVANSSTLFYKAESYEHREKLRAIFPYVLGAVTPEVLALFHERRQLELELGRKQREFEALSQVSQRWIADLRSRVVSAREYGLIAEPLPSDASVERMLQELRRVLEGPATPSIRLGTVAEAIDELIEIEREEIAVSTELSALRSRFVEMKRLRESAGDYRQSLEVKLDRLSIADWMLSHSLEKACPICGSRDKDNTEELEELARALQVVEDEHQHLSRVPASFERELQRVGEGIEIATEKLEGVQIRRKALLARSDRARAKQFTEERVARFLGSLEQALEGYDRLAAGGVLREELTALQERLRAIRRRLAGANLRRAVERAIAQFGVYAQRVFPRMDVERPDDAIVLSIQDLSLRIRGRDREDFLWEIGSGANWVAYHVATMVGLHRLFGGLPHSPVPAFCVFDQPSQVYFPRPSLARPLTSERDDQEPALADEDIQGVRKIFSVLAATAVEAQGAWQAIVLDHADEEVWGGIPGMHLVETWRKGLKLVPDEWLV